MSEDGKNELTSEDKRILKYVADAAREEMPSRRGFIQGTSAAVALGALGFGAGSATAQTQPAAGQVGTESKPVDVEGASVNVDELSTADHFVGSGFKSLSTALSEADQGDHICILGGYTLGQSHDVTTAGLTLSSRGEVDFGPYGFDINADNVSFRPFHGVSTASSGSGNQPMLTAATTSQVENFTVSDSVFESNGVHSEIVLGSPNNALTKASVKDSVLKESDNQSLISFRNGEEYTVEDNRLIDAGRSAVMFIGVDGGANVSDGNVKNNYIERWMQTANEPDGAVQAYGQGESNIGVDDNTIKTGSANQGKGYNVVRLIDVSGNCTVEDNQINVNTPDVTNVINVSARNTSPDSVVFERNTVSVNTTVDNALLVESARRFISSENDWQLSGATFSDVGLVVNGVDHATFDDDSTDALPVRFLRYRGANGTVKITNCELAHELDILRAVGSATIDHLIITGNASVASGGSNVTIEDGFGYVNVSNNYLETDDTVAIANAGVASTDQEEIHHNLTNTA